jgi:hypothetical protein
MFEPVMFEPVTSADPSACSCSGGEKGGQQKAPPKRGEDSASELLGRCCGAPVAEEGSSLSLAIVFGVCLNVRKISGIICVGLRVVLVRAT